MKIFTKFTADPADQDNIGGMRPSIGRLPAMTCDAFATTERTKNALQMMQSSRHLSRVRCQLMHGDLDSAIGAYSASDSPDLLIVEVGDDATTVFRQLEALADLCRVDTELVLIGPSNDITLYRALTRQGVADYLQTPVTAPLVVTALFELFRDPDKVNLGKIHAVIGARGGAGSSSVAHNVAWMLGEQARAQSVLVDADFQFGTAALCLNRSPEQDIVGAIANSDKLDDQKLERLLINYDDQLRLLASPLTLQKDNDLDPEAFAYAMDLVRVLSPNVVLDLPSALGPLTRKALYLADEVVLVATPDLASLRNTRSMLEMMSSIRIGEQKPKLVLNQINQPKRPEIKPVDFVKALGLEEPVLLPFDAAKYGAADNNGTLVAQHRQNRVQRQAYSKLASGLSGLSQITPQGGGLKFLKRSGSKS